jgi:lipopolysaccharide transport protein LptA
VGTKPRSIKKNGRTLLIALWSTVLVWSHQNANASGQISAEEQRLRDLFLQVREENRREGLDQPKPPAPIPAPPTTSPRKAPTPNPIQKQPLPPRTQGEPEARAETAASAPIPGNTGPTPATRESNRSGHTGPPPIPESEPPVASQPSLGPAPANNPESPRPSPPSSSDHLDTNDGLGAKDLDLAGSLHERLTSLPRTPQSRAKESAHSTTPVPALSPDPSSIPVTKSKDTSLPKTLARKPTETLPTPVLKIGADIPVKPEPMVSAIEPVESPSENRIANPGRLLPGTDPGSLLEDKNDDLKISDPDRQESLAEAAESIRRSLLEDDTDGKVESVSGTVASATTRANDTARAPAPVPAMPPLRSAPVRRPSAGGMTGAVFERFVRQAMTLGMTAVIATKAKPPTLAEPELKLLPQGDDGLQAPAEPDPVDEVPDYVKAARKLAQPLENFPALPENNQPPGLNDFVISATHQTDFDMDSSSITFAGHVVVESSRFHLTCDKFIVHMLPDQKGMEYGEALGNVIIRMMEDHKPTGHTGVARSAIYHPEDGEIILSGWPRIVEETKELVGITADAKMILTTSGSVRTIGRNRTILKQ